MQNSTNSDKHGNRYKMIQSAVLFIALILTFSSTLYAQSYCHGCIFIRLYPPPPEHLGVGDLWNLELNNTTDKPIKIYLTGTAKEQKDGLIIEGKTKMFTVKPGKTSYKYKDFPGAEIKYNNGKYKEIILRTGNAPEGEYTICVTAFTEGGEIAGQENCIEQSVKQQGSISLISPEDGAEINTESPINFIWIGTGLKGPYTLKIVEIKGSQSPDEAIKGSVFYEKEGLSATTYQYPLDAPKFIEGKKYAWVIVAGDNWSQPFLMEERRGHPRVGPNELRIALIQNNNVYAKVTTDSAGQFTFRDIPAGEYNLKISSEGAANDHYLMMYGGGGIIICCCPGPPCDDPLVIYVGTAIKDKLKAIFFPSGETIQAQLLPVKWPPEGPWTPHR